MHPYKSLPDRQYWSRAVSSNFDASAVPKGARLLSKGDKVVTAGSCFAANLVPYIERSGFEYIRTEYQGAIFDQVSQENLSYAKFSAGYGNIYTARQLHQLLLRAMGRFTPAEDRWITDDGVIDPFRPGLRYMARSEVEFDYLTKQHLAATLRAFRQCDVFIFTLGLTEAWVSTIDGAVFPACPGTIAGTFDEQKHRFINFSVADITGDLQSFVRLLREVNPAVRMILTVSPVPLVATATESHVLAATVYSKSVLRVASEEASLMENVSYFPSYEIVTGPQAPDSFFETDRRNVSAGAVDTVMAAFMAHCEGGELNAGAPVEKSGSAADRISLSHLMMELECEEAAQDSG